MNWDLIEHFKIDVQFCDDHVLHVEYVSDLVRGLRKARLERRWYTKQHIGNGSFGDVLLQVQREGNRDIADRAVKVIQKRRMKNVGIDYRRELLALAKLSKYPELFVVLRAWYEDDNNIFLAMEYFPLGDLDGYIARGISEDAARTICAQLLDGLSKMHSIGFTHRDMKPRNIFVVSETPQWWVKIGDFGISKRVSADDTALRTQTGTQLFQAPEIHGYTDAAEGSSEYTNAVDMWSLGCVAHLMLAQEAPFPNLRAVNSYCSGRLPFPAQALNSKNITENGVTFVRALLDPQPHQRMTAESASQHEWLQSVEPDPPIPGDSQSTMVEDDMRQALPQAPSRGLVTNSESDVLSCRDTELQRVSVKLPDPIDPDSSIGSSNQAPGTTEKPSDKEIPQGRISFYGDSFRQLELKGWSPSATSIAVELENKGSIRQPPSHGLQRISSLPRHGSVNETSLEGIITHPADANYNNIAFPVSTSLVETLHPKASTPKPETEIADVTLETHKNDNGELPHSGDTIKNDADIEACRVIDLGPPENAGQRFLLAAQEGHTEVLGAYLDEGFYVDFFDVEGRTALHLAILQHQSKTVSWLVRNGANVATSDASGRMALHYACDQRNPKIVELLLEAGCNVNAQSHELITPLHMASWKGCQDILELLLKFGANVNVEDKHMGTPLHWAVWSSDWKIVQCLINAGADLFAQNAVGSRPLTRARGSKYVLLENFLRDAERDQLKNPTLPAGWEKKLTVTGGEYYINHHTNKLSLTGPGLASAALAASLRFQGYELVCEVDHLWLKDRKGQITHLETSQPFAGTGEVVTLRLMLITDPKLALSMLKRSTDAAKVLGKQQAPGIFSFPLEPRRKFVLETISCTNALHRRRRGLSGMLAKVTENSPESILITVTVNGRTSKIGPTRQSSRPYWEPKLELLLNSQSVIRIYFFVDRRFNLWSNFELIGKCIVVVDRCIDLDYYKKQTFERHLMPNTEDDGFSHMSSSPVNNIVTFEILQPVYELA